MSSTRTPRLIRAIRWTRLLLHLASAFLTLRFAWPRANAERRHEIAVRWARNLLSILAIRVRCEGRPPPHARHGAMIAGNHVSWVDIFAIASVRHTRFIAKSEIRDWPLAGWLAEKSGTIFIRRARRHDTARINALVHDALAEGDCVGLFPEGTTTEGDRLLKAGERELASLSREDLTKIFINDEYLAFPVGAHDASPSVRRYAREGHPFQLLFRERGA